eukprot:2493673-Karenia_brevis.AAC.1
MPGGDTPSIPYDDWWCYVMHSRRLNTWCATLSKMGIPADQFENISSVNELGPFLFAKFVDYKMKASKGQDS